MDDVKMRWQGVADRWPTRSALVATLIPPGSSVLDLGAGAGGLEGHLPAGCTYTGIDLPDFDMNKGKWPEGRWDVAVMAGVLEYSRYPAAALRHLHELAPMAIVTYAHHPKRRDLMWNNLAREDIVALAKKAGYTAREAATWTSPSIKPQAVWVLE
jgi:hypothetical protein